MSINVHTGERGIRSIAAEHDHKEYDVAAIIASYITAVYSASTLVFDTIREDNPEYLLGMAELIAHSNGLNSDHVEDVKEDILDQFARNS